MNKIVTRTELAHLLNYVRRLNKKIAIPHTLKDTKNLVGVLKYDKKFDKLFK